METVETGTSPLRGFQIDLSLPSYFQDVPRDCNKVPAKCLPPVQMGLYPLFEHATAADKKMRVPDELVPFQVPRLGSEHKFCIDSVNYILLKQSVDIREGDMVVLVDTLAVLLNVLALSPQCELLERRRWPVLVYVQWVRHSVYGKRSVEVSHFTPLG